MAPDSLRVEVDDEPAFEATRVDLRLALGAAPVLRLELPATTRDPLPLAEWTRDGAPCRLRWGDEELSFQAAGGHDDPNAPRVLYGLALADTHLRWLATRPYVGDRLLHLLYQRWSDDQGWKFLDRVLGGRLALPSRPALFDTLLPFEACLWRPASSTHLGFLRSLVPWLRTLHGDLLGWTLVDADEPIRLCLLDPADVPAIPGDTVGPFHLHPLAAPSGTRPFETRFDRSLDEGSGSSGSRLLRSLVRGDNDAKRWPVPGAVALGPRRLACRAVDYRFEEAATVSVTTYLEPWPPAAVGGASSVLLDARFGGRWESEGGGDGESETLLALEPEGPWVVFAGDEEDLDDGQLPAIALMARGLVPQGSRDDRCGIYPVRRPGDPLTVLVAPGRTAMALGQSQARCEGLDGAGLVIGADRLVVTASPSDVEPGDSDGLDLDAAAGRAEVRQADAGAVRLERQGGRATLAAESALTLETPGGDLAIDSRNASLDDSKLHLLRGELAVG